MGCDRDRRTWPGAALGGLARLGLVALPWIGLGGTSAALRAWDGEGARGPVSDWAAASARAAERGVDFLVGHQNADGSWGSFESRRSSEIYRGTVASFRAFRDASSALCLMALLEPSRRRPDAWRALERGVEHLLASEPPGRATPTTFYGIWAHTYVLRALAAAHGDGRFADRRERIAGQIELILERLERLQGADGGWGYFDFGHGLETPSGLQSTSFNSASVLIALKEAEAAGFAFDERRVRDGLRSLDRARGPSGAFLYGTGYLLLPGSGFNQPQGAATRTQSGNLALLLHGGRIDAGEITRGLSFLRDHHPFLDIAYGRPLPHETWYQNSGYYVLYGHFYAAALIRTLEEPERGEYRRWQVRTLLRRQNSDGSWCDFPLYGYHRAYGTAYALLALQQHH